MNTNKKILLTLTPALADKLKKFAQENGYSGVCDLIRRVVANYLRAQGVKVSEDEIKVIQGKRNDLKKK